MNGLQLAEKALTYWRKRRGNQTTYELCQKFDGYYMQEAFLGWGSDSRIIKYGSAQLAYEASDIFTRNVNSASIRPGDSLYYKYKTAGHIITAIGRDERNGRVLATQTANKGTVVKRLTNNVKIVYADSIGLPFLGASHRNGKNRERTGITPWNINKQTPTPVIPPGTGKVFPMALYSRAKNDTRIFEISTGFKYYISKDAWKMICASFAKAGSKVPYSTDIVTKAQMDALPSGK